MRFPLSDWIEEHADCRHNLGRSGMVGSIRHPVASRTQVAAATDATLVTELSRLLGVDPSRVFLTHGATEANAWATTYLRRKAPRASLRCRVRFPEYPPLWGMAKWAGFTVGEFRGRVPLAIVSQPRNPEGFLWTPGEFDSWIEGARWVLVDETFREFTDAASLSTRGDPRIWTTGTLTKAYAGDDIRVGWLVAPPHEAPEFARFHGLATDELAPTSTAMALGTLRDRTRVLRHARGVFERNRRALAAHLPSGGDIRAPLYFDRPPGGRGEILAQRCLRASVLVCPGSMFGDPRGVRLCLTRRSFPSDLSAYLRVRETLPTRPGR